jgi:hypothetical protein
MTNIATYCTVCTLAAPVAAVDWAIKNKTKKQNKDEA